MIFKNEKMFFHFFLFFITIIQFIGIFQCFILGHQYYIPMNIRSYTVGTDYVKLRKIIIKEPQISVMDV